MDNVLTDDTVCIFTHPSSDTEIVGVSIRYAVQTIKHFFDSLAIDHGESRHRFNWQFNSINNTIALRFWGAYIWRGLNMEGLILGILRYFHAAANRDI